MSSNKDQDQKVNPSGAPAAAATASVAVANNNKDLDDLLDSALDDFDKFGITDNSTTATKNAGDKSNKAVEGDDSAVVVNEELWDNEFLAEQAKLFQDQMASLFLNSNTGENSENDMPSPEQFQKSLLKMREAATIAMTSDSNPDNKVVDSITDVLKGLKEGSDNIESNVLQNDLLNMFSGLESGDGDSNPFVPYMQGMMYSLLSAEVLLPSLKDLLDKYPQWMEENGDKIDASEKERYLKQQEIFKIVCADLELENPNDTEDVKNERFKRVLENMQKLQEYGQPPEELIAIPGGPNMPQMDSEAAIDTSQCSIM